MTYVWSGLQSEFFLRRPKLEGGGQLKRRAAREPAGGAARRGRGRQRVGASVGLRAAAILVALAVLLVCLGGAKGRANLVGSATFEGARDGWEGGCSVVLAGAL